MKKNLEIHDFTGEDEAVVEGTRPSSPLPQQQEPRFASLPTAGYATSLDAAKGNLSSQLEQIQSRMQEIQQRRGEVEERRGEEAKKARERAFVSSLLDMQSKIGGQQATARERADAQAAQEKERTDRDFLMLEQELQGLEGLQGQASAAAVELMSQEETAQGQQKALQELNDPNSEVSRQARLTAELVLGQGSLPLDVSASQIEKVYSDILENKRYQEKQDFEKNQASIERSFKASQAEKNRAQQAQAAQLKGGTPIKSNQAISAGFGRRMQQAVEVFENLDKQGFDRGSLSAGLGATLPNFLQSSEQQQQSQAERNFINATLRRESGAAIAESEFDSAEKQYFPRAGDSPEVIKQKERNREQVINMMKAEAGPAWEAIELVTRDEGKSDSEPEKAPRKKFVPGQGMAKSSSGRRIFGE